jgi:hypothetical protein
MVGSARDVFVAMFNGCSIACGSVDDASAINAADEIFRRRTECDYTPQQLERLAAVLIRYGRDAEAETLSHYSSQQRAAQFLAQSVGYQRPAKHPR